ncbi:hypothetical protein J6590_027896 [Homalodisca vitripennis]|nr:hypothetical protein J6590_027896 [Homalodisca vitripennis]
MKCGCAVPDIVSRCQKYEEQEIIATNDDVILMICRSGSAVRLDGAMPPDAKQVRQATADCGIVPIVEQ